MHEINKQYLFRDFILKTVQDNMKKKMNNADGTKKCMGERKNKI